MIKNLANQRVAFQAISPIDGSSVTSGLSASNIRINGLALAAGSLEHVGDGEWDYIPTLAETNADEMRLQLFDATVINQAVTIYPQALDYRNAEVTTDAASRTASQADVSNLDVAVSTRMPTTHISASGGAVDDVSNVGAVSSPVQCDNLEDNAIRAASYSANAITATAIAAGALDGKGDWSTHAVTDVVTGGPIATSGGSVTQVGTVVAVGTGAITATSIDEMFKQLRDLDTGALLQEIRETTTATKQST